MRPVDEGGCAQWITMVPAKAPVTVYPQGL